MTDREIFKANLYNLMKASKVKQIDIAKYTDVSQKTVSAWVCGRAYPRADAMEKLCKFFNVRQSALTESPNPQQLHEDKLLLLFRSLPEEAQMKLLDRAFELKKLYPKRGKSNG